MVVTVKCDKNSKIIFFIICPREFWVGWNQGYQIRLVESNFANFLKSDK